MKIINLQILYNYINDLLNSSGDKMICINSNKQNINMKLFQFVPEISHDRGCTELYTLAKSNQLIKWHNVKYMQPALQWRHDGRDGVSNHQPHDCLLNRSFRRRSKKISALCTGIHRWSVNSPHKGPATQKMFPFDDVIMVYCAPTTRAAYQEIYQKFIWSYGYCSETIICFVP